MRCRWQQITIENYACLPRKFITLSVFPENSIDNRTSVLFCNIRMLILPLCHFINNSLFTTLVKVPSVSSVFHKMPQGNKQTERQTFIQATFMPQLLDLLMHDEICVNPSAGMKLRNILLDQNVTSDCSFWSKLMANVTQDIKRYQLVEAKTLFQGLCWNSGSFNFELPWCKKQKNKTKQNKKTTKKPLKYKISPIIAKPSLRFYIFWNLQYLNCSKDLMYNGVFM